MASIRQNRNTHALPDWRNLGVLLRVLLGANLLAALAALMQSSSLLDWGARFVLLAAGLEWPLLMVIGVLALLRDLLWRMPVWWGRTLVIALATCGGFLQHFVWYWLALSDEVPGGALRSSLLAAAVAALLLYYLELRARAFSPAVAEARLMALNARIRPHFLFNAINAVLSLIRANPRQAEEVLETVSELFRAALRDPGDWLPLSDEIALCRQYLELEKLRLGDRLHVEWDVRAVPLDDPIPPLMLQPLVENAVYHGIEPAPEGGTIHIVFTRERDEMRIEVRNPTSGGQRQAAGNHMALANIRERLALYYDLEARLDIEEANQTYRVCIHLPCKTSRSTS